MSGVIRGPVSLNKIGVRKSELTAHYEQERASSRKRNPKKAPRWIRVYSSSGMPHRTQRGEFEELVVDAVSDRRQSNHGRPRSRKLCTSPKKVRRMLRLMARRAQ